MRSDMRRHIRALGLAITLGYSSWPCAPLQAQVVTDGSLGSAPAGALTGPDYTIPANLGHTAGDNLFHSFSEFNINAGESATFTGPAHIANVLSRVTGGSVSNIDGLLRTSGMPNANFFLMNPAGVVFGPGAQIDVPGAFVVTTANELHLADGGKLAASTNPAESVLTTAPPSAFGFLSQNPAGVQMTGGILNVAEQQAITIVAGDVSIDQSTLTAPGGAVNVVSVASQGQVSFDASDQSVQVDADAFEEMGSIEVVNGSSVNLDGEGGGRVMIRGGQLMIADSTLSARTLGDTDGQGVEIAVTDQFSFVRSKIDTRTQGQGDAGDVDLMAQTLLLDGRNADGEVGIFTDSLGVLLLPIVDLLVTLDITHTWDADLTAILESPAGTRIVLFSEVGGDGDNFTDTTFREDGAVPIFFGVPPFSGEFQPAGTFFAFVGEVAEGVWVLEITDTFPTEDDGSLNSWSLSAGGSTFASTDVGQVISAASPLVRSELVVDAPGLVIQGIPGFIPGRAGDIQINAQAVEVLGEPLLSAATANPAVTDFGTVAINTPTLLLDGVPAGFVVNPPEFVGKPPGAVEFFESGAVVLDGSFGVGGALEGPVFMIPTAVGRMEGSNLFHSFSVFDPSPDQTVDFLGPESGSVSNILVRVTGGPSNINGTIRATGIPGANFFFMNPAGVMFGPHGQLEVVGAFTVTTADVISSEAVGQFSADPADDGATLLTDTPTLFAFLSDTPAPVQVINSRIDTFGEDVSIISGDIQLLGSRIDAPSGRINLVAGASAGEVTLDTTQHGALPAAATFPTRGTLAINATGDLGLGTFSTATLNVGGGGGRIEVLAGRMTMDGGSVLSATNIDDVQVERGGIHIDLTGDLAMTDLSRIVVQTTGSAPGGDVTLNAQRVLMSVTDSPLCEFFQAQGLTCLPFIASFATGDGQGGDIDIQADSITLNPGNIATFAAFPDPDSFSFGNAGDVTIQADQVLLFGDDTSIITDSNSFGQAGGVTLTLTDMLSINDGASVSSAAIFGRGGTVDIAADVVEVIGAGSAIQGSDAGFEKEETTVRIVARQRVTVSGTLEDENATVISADTFSLDNSGEQMVGGGILIDTPLLRVEQDGRISSSALGAGNGGTVELKVTRLEMDTDSSISADSFGSGKGGQVKITAEEINLDGGAGISTFASPFQFQNEQDALPQEFLGATGGTILINTTSLTAQGGGVISAATVNGGDAGSVHVEAQTTILISGELSGIRSPSTAENPEIDPVSGRGGNIEVHAHELIIEKQGQISATTNSTGQAGDITINVDSLLIHDAGRVASESIGENLPGNAGTIQVIAADRVLLRNQGEVTTKAVMASADPMVDQIQIMAGSTIDLFDSTISSEAAFKGGNIRLMAPQRVLAESSVITATAGAVGGNITIDPQLIVLNRSEINASAPEGQGGNILFTADAILRSNDTIISATGARSGTIQINAPDIDLSGALVAQPVSLLNTKTQLVPHCAVQFGKNASSFTLGTPGGVPLDPFGWQPTVDLAGQAPGRAPSGSRDPGHDE